ncbi:MAG: hypothetical protein LBC99_06390, partial [Spirochaetota bacterium]|nr:hypothetical protein [Spirochaetota bacterium]
MAILARGCAVRPRSRSLANILILRHPKSKPDIAGIDYPLKQLALSFHHLAALPYCLRIDSKTP